jgi:NADH-quinone oxidoreductase subunit M
MISIPALLLITFAAGLLAFIAHHIFPVLRDVIVIIAVAIAGYIVWQLNGNIPDITFTVGDFTLSWGASEYSRLFGLLIAVLSFFAIVYSSAFMEKRDRKGYYYMNFLFSIGAMFGIVYSQDLISLFFFWEIMTWSSFMMTIYCCEEAQSVGLKYFVFSAIGAYSIITAVVIIYANIDSFLLKDVFANFGSLSEASQIAVVVLMIIGFGVKSAMMPLHVWAPDAYKMSPAPFTAIFSGALSKMGIFGIGLVLFKMAATQGFYIYVQEILAWIGALTALFATLYAIFQTDAKKLLAYSSIGQLGYIITGLAIGTPLSISAALFLTVMHGIFKSMLFFTVGAIQYRTGTTDMNEISGLIRKMPYTFITALFGIITVSGVPPLAGFAGKWMLYESLIQSNHYFLVVVVFFASTAAFLYLYRFIFSLFLGQEEEETKDIKEAPLRMTVPMIILSLSTLLFGVYPGLLLDPISSAMSYLGNFNNTYETSILFNDWGNLVNMNTIMSAIGIIFVIVAVIITIIGYKKTRYVTTKDIHTSGEIPTENENLTYAVDFYKPFERALGSVLKPSVDKFFTYFGNLLEESFEHLRYIYTGNGQTYAMYVMVFLLILFLFSELIFNVAL